MSGSTSGGGAIGEAVASIVLAAVNARRKAKADKALRNMIAAAELAGQRERQQRQAWLEAVLRQNSRGKAATNGTMRDVHRAQHNPLDERMFGKPGPVVAPADGAPSPLVFGVELLDRDTGQTGTAAYYDGNLPVIVCGAMGAGKSTRFLTPFNMTARNQNVIAFCAKGTGPFQTWAERARFSTACTVNPCGVLGMRDAHFNPIARFKCDSPRFRRDCIAVAEAIHDPEMGVGTHFRTGSVAASACLTGWEVMRARRTGRVPYLPNLRTMLCEPDRWEEYTDAAGKPARRLVGGVTHTFAQIAKSGHPALADMAGKFLREHGKDELAGVFSTLETQCRFLHDPAIMQMMRGPGVDLTRLCDGDEKGRPYSISIVIPPEDLSEFNRVVRLVVTTALNSHFRPGKYKTVFVLDEFRATVGTLPIIRDLWSVMREYRAQFLALVTSLTQFEAIWGKEWENMLGQCGAVVLLGPAPDAPSAEWFSKRGGTTTIAQLGYSENAGSSSGKNSGTGFGSSVGGFNTNENSGLNVGASEGGSLSVTQSERRALLPQDLMSLPPGEGRMWFPNMGERSVPIFAPNYWRRRGDWVRRVRKNPYYKG